MFEMVKQKIKLLAISQSFDGLNDKITIKPSSSTIRCFWTWPFGHIWGEPRGDGYEDRYIRVNPNRYCVICGQLKDTNKHLDTNCMDL